jgi:stress response protein YsnF
MIDMNPSTFPTDMTGQLETVSETATLSLVQEQIELTREKIVTATVRVEKTQHSEMSRITCPIREEKVSITRVPKNEHVEEEYEAKLVDGTWIIPVFEYVPVTYNQLVLKEEVHVTTTRSDSVAEIDVPVEIQRVRISRKKAGEDIWTSVEEITSDVRVFETR